MKRPATICLIVLSCGALQAWASDAWLAEAAQCSHGHARSDGDGARLIAAECPEVAQALRRNAWGGALANYTVDELTQGQLQSVAAIASVYQDRGTAPRPGRAALQGVLATLPQHRAEAVSVWDRILDRAWEWLKTTLIGEGPDGRKGFLARWLDKFEMPGWVWDWTRYLTWAVLLLGALAVVVNELRHAGAFRRAGHRDAGRPEPPAGAQGRPVSQPPNGADTALPGDPSGLLRLVLARLRQLHPGLFGPTRTHRELLVSAQRVQSERQPALRALVDGAERVVYGGCPPQAPDLRPAVASGQRLLEELKAAQTS